MPRGMMFLVLCALLNQLAWAIDVSTVYPENIYAIIIYLYSPLQIALHVHQSMDLVSGKHVQQQSSVLSYREIAYLLL